MSKFKDNKGITLLEIIIAIAIFSTVIFIGYKIINTSNKEIKEQSIVFNEQQAINILNKYLSKDLEVTKEVKLIYNKDQSREINEQIEGYKLTTIDDKEIIYTTEIKNPASEGRNGKFSIYRDGIEIIRNMVYSYTQQNNPITLSQNEDNSYYDISILGNSNEFEFKVSPRIGKTNFITEPPEPPINPPQPPPGGSTDLIPIIPGIKSEGNIVIYEYEDSKEVSINISSEKQNNFENKVRVRKYNEHKKTSYNLIITTPNRDEFILNDDKTLSIISNGNYKKISDNKEVIIGNKKFEFDKEKGEISVDGDLIIDIDSENIYIFKNTSNEISIEFDSDGEVDIELGNDDSSYNYSQDNNDNIDIEVSKELFEGDEPNIEIKTVKTRLEKVNNKNVDNDNLHYLKFDECLSEDGRDNDVDIDIDTEQLKSGSIVIVNFKKPKITKGIKVEHGMPTKVYLINENEYGEEELFELSDIGPSDNNGADDIDVEIDFNKEVIIIEYKNKKNIITSSHKVDIQGIYDRIHLQSRDKVDIRVNDKIEYNKIDGDVIKDIGSKIEKINVQGIKVNHGSKSEFELIWSKKYRDYSRQ